MPALQTYSSPSSPNAIDVTAAAHAPSGRRDVGCGVPLWMTDVQTDAGRVGEHVEDAVLGPAAPARGAEGPVLVAVALPAGLDLEVVVGHTLLYRRCYGHSKQNGLRAARDCETSRVLRRRAGAAGLGIRGGAPCSIS